MKLEKAIDILKLEDNATLPPRKDDLFTAMRLGIEALKRIKQDRIVNDDLNPYLLHGETK